MKRGIISRLREDRRLWRNRLAYIVALAVVFILARVYGGRTLYVALYTMLMIPVFSYALTYLLLRGLRVTQHTDQTMVVKGEPGRYRIVVRNYLPVPFDNIRCVFRDDGFAIDTDGTVDRLFVRPFMRATYTVTFYARYRGVYQLGLSALHTYDLTGLFALRRGLKGTFTLTAMPRAAEMDSFPMAARLVSQSQSRFDIREEDYATVSDIRRYAPEDSIKRVHWKLTAKRGEWMVKQFQSNARHRVTLILDTLRAPMPYTESLPLEDRIIETILSLIRLLLRQQIPVELIIGRPVKQADNFEAVDDIRHVGETLADFETLYHMAAGVVFHDAVEKSDALPLLERRLNDAAGYINALVATTRLDDALAHRILMANRAGHYVAPLYFARETPDSVSESVFNLLLESGVDCRRFTEDAPYET